jgi:hypothetical protein
MVFFVWSAAILGIYRLKSQNELPFSVFKGVLMD